MEQETWMEDCLASLDFSDICRHVPNSQHILCKGYIKAMLKMHGRTTLHLRLWVGDPPCTPGILADWQTQGGKNTQISKRRCQWLVFLLAWLKAFLNLKGRVPPFFLGDFRQNRQTEFQLGVYCASFFLLSAPQLHRSDGYQDELQPGERRAITARMLFVGPIFWFWRGRTEKIWKDMVDVVIGCDW